MRKFLLAATAIVLVASATVALANLTSIGVTNGVPTSGTGTVSTIDNLIAVGSPNALVTTGGWTPVVKTSITTAQTIKSSSGWLGKAQCDNNNNTWSYLQIFNTTTPTLGSTLPLDVVPIAPNLSNGYAMNSTGEQFSTAISVAATTTPNGNTTVSTGLNCGFAFN